MKNDSCPKCSSTEIIPNAEISYGVAAAGNSPRSSISVALNSARRANELFSKVAKTGEMRAWVCAECGFTEIYTFGIGEISAGYKRN